MRLLNCPALYQPHGHRLHSVRFLDRALSVILRRPDPHSNISLLPLCLMQLFVVAHLAVGNILLWVQEHLDMAWSLVRRLRVSRLVKLGE